MFITWITVILGMCNVGILSWEPKLYRTFAVSLVVLSFNSYSSEGVLGRSRTEKDEEGKEEEEELMPDPRYTLFHHC